MNEYKDYNAIIKNKEKIEQFHKLMFNFSLIPEIKLVYEYHSTTLQFDVSVGYDYTNINYYYCYLDEYFENSEFSIDSFIKILNGVYYRLKYNLFQD